MSARQRLLERARADRQTNIKGLSRAIGKGLSFGFNDEIEAKLKSVFSDEDYETIVQGIRQEEAEFKETGPQVPLPLTDATISAATLAELIGSVPTSLGGAGFLAKQGVKGLGKIGAVEGGIYGAGDTTAETGLGQAADVVTSGMAGGVLSKTGDVIMPVAKEGYDILRRRGVEGITPGQAYKALDKPEQAQKETTALLGPLIQERRDEAKQSFTQKLFEEAVEGTGIKVNLGTKNKMYDQTYDALNKQYTDLTKNTSFVRTQNFESQIDDIVNKAVPDGLPDADKLRTKYKNELNAYLLRLDGSGNTFKSVDSSLAKVGRKLAKSTGDDTKIPIKEQIFQQTRNTLRDEFRKQNGEVAGDTLDILDNSFFKLKILESASEKGQQGTDYIRPSTIRTVWKSVQGPAMSRKGKNKLLTGQTPFAELMEAGTILDDLGTSNTPSLIMQNPTIMGSLLTQAVSPEKTIGVLGGLLGGTSIYADKQSTDVARRLVKPVGTAIGKSLQSTAPFMGSGFSGGLLGLRDDDINQIRQISSLAETP